VGHFLELPVLAWVQLECLTAFALAIGILGVTGQNRNQPVAIAEVTGAEVLPFSDS
jgi:hypothetical protein